MKFDRFATIVALITHPVIIGTLGLLTVVNLSIPSWIDRLYYLAMLILLTFAPAALYLFVKFDGNVTEMLELIDREARLVPYLLMIAGAVAAVIFLGKLQAPIAIVTMTTVLLANEVILGTVNFWTKVSIHTATTTFTAITLGYLINPWWYLLLILIPVISWARVYRRRHTIRQVIGGTLSAAVITLTTLALIHSWLV